MLDRFLIHGMVCVVWIISAIMLIPPAWWAMNDVFWRIGIGDVLVERPVAAVHHRMMGTYSELEILGERESYFRGHLHAYPDSPERQSWQAQLDEVSAARTMLLLKVFGVVIASYLPIAELIEWRRLRDRSAGGGTLRRAQVHMS